jgi:hypothetical protein
MYLSDQIFRQKQNKLAIFSYLTNLLNFDAAEHVILFLWQVRKWG